MSRSSIVVTGATGKLARAVITELNRSYDLRSYDVIPVHRETPVWTGPIAGLINCAGAYNTGAWNNPVLWERMLDSNISVQLEYIMSALPHMSAGGLIINVTAQIAATPHLAKPFEAAYAASKAALSAATASLRAELKPIGIDVHEYQPGLMPTGEAYGHEANALATIVREKLGK
jgi:short-subunit dehydrogenase